jgi:hypothetical protein
VAASTNRWTRRGRRRTIGAALAAAVLVVGLVLVARNQASVRSAAGPSCVASVGKVSYALDGEQAANASTIAAVGKRMGMPDHAVTVALAAALQESGLHNLPGGDRDSLGLFQQRPSQGWGTPEAIMVPRESAAAFYQHLGAVPGWESLPVTEAAQSVQHSAAPSAYARWESQARVLARVLTGEVPAGLACRYATPTGPPATASLDAAMSAELGVPDLGTTVDSDRGWLVASWLLAHGSEFRVGAVTFDGQRWTPTSGRWRAQAPAVAVVQI